MKRSKFKGRDVHEKDILRQLLMRLGGKIECVIRVLPRRQVNTIKRVWNIEFSPNIWTEFFMER